MPSRRLLTPSVARCAALVAGVGIVLAGCGLDGPTPEPGLSAPEVYARVAPGVGYIETSLGSGTGVLVAPGRLVTNAHVVWPYGEVRVASFTSSRATAGIEGRSE